MGGVSSPTPGVCCICNIGACVRLLYGAANVCSIVVWRVVWYRAGAIVLMRDCAHVAPSRVPMAECVVPIRAHVAIVVASMQCPGGRRHSRPGFISLRGGCSMPSENTKRKDFCVAKVTKRGAVTGMELFCATSQIYNGPQKGRSNRGS